MLQPIIKFLYKIAVSTGVIHFWRIAKRVRERGIRFYVTKYTHKVRQSRFLKQLRRRRVQQQLRKILANSKFDRIVVSLSFIDWNVPLFQRPQHIAKQLCKQGVLYFYHTRNYYDRVSGFQKIEDNLYLIDDFDLVIELLGEHKKTIHLYSTNMYADDDARISKALARKETILYEYIDEIDEHIAGHKIPDFVYKRHRKLLQDKGNCYVVSTATKLLNNVVKLRKNKQSLITNGVTLEDFSEIAREIPEEMKEIVASGKPIIGYYGALAKWFDYELVKQTALACPEWQFVLIGWDYDGSLKKSKIAKIPNIKILGPIPYLRLPQYAQWFSVSTIPFLINEITKSTSPVKIFEYMALGKPIVTTPMPECKKYESVVITESKPASFKEKISLALAKANDMSYKNLLAKNAEENTWKSKAAEILTLLDN